MLQIIQMAYMTAMMIGAAAFGIQVMTSVKNLCVDSNMVKSKEHHGFFRTDLII